MTGNVTINKKDFKIVRNSIYNFIGWFLPTVVSFFSVPFVVRLLGNDSYGILTISIAVIGYFSLMDINLSAGSIRYIAEYHAKGNNNKVNEVISFSLLCYLLAGVSGAVLLYLSVDLLLMNFLKLPDAIKGISRTVFHLTSIGFFLNIIQNYLLSIPKSIHRFDISARIEAGFSIALTLGTVSLLFLGFNLIEVVTLRIILLFLNCIILFIIVKKIIPSVHFISKISRETVRKVATFGGYSFLSRLSATVTANTDRLAIGAFISSAAVTLYTIPFMLVSRLMHISFRLSAVLFPVASVMGSLNQQESLKNIYIKISRHIFFLNISLTTIICLFSKQILQLWMGNDFAQQTYMLLILISLAFFVDTLTNLPSLLNDGLSYPQVTGFFALARAIFGLIVLIIGSLLWGLIGVAIAYLISSVIMGGIFLLYVHKKTIKISLQMLVKEAFLKSFIFSLLVSALMLIVKSLLPLSRSMFILELFFVIILFAIYGYKIVLDDKLKTKIATCFSIAK